MFWGLPEGVWVSLTLSGCKAALEVFLPCLSPSQVHQLMLWEIQHAIWPLRHWLEVLIPSYSHK